MVSGGGMPYGIFGVVRVFYSYMPDPVGDSAGSAQQLLRTASSLHMSTPLIQACGVSRSFGPKRVLDIVDLELGAGNVCGLVGLNGAGKTTLIRLLLGLLRSDGGTLSVLGFDPWHHDAEYYRRVGVVLEHDGFWGNLTYRENLDLFGRAKGLSRKEIDRYVEEQWGQTEIAHDTKQAKLLSRGQRMQCALSRAFLGDPDVCLLDEPAVALDVEAYDHFCELVRTARARGAAVLISSHQLDTIQQLCDVVGLLQGGRIHMLDNAESPTNTEWIIRTGNGSSCGAIIAQHADTDPSYENGRWRFSVTDAESAVPRIVAALVAAGCSIKEVRPVERDLRRRLRATYARTGRSE